MAKTTFTEVTLEGIEPDDFVGRLGVQRMNALLANQRVGSQYHMSTNPQIDPYWELTGVGLVAIDDETSLTFDDSVFSALHIAEIIVLLADIRRGPKDPFTAHDHGVMDIKRHGRSIGGRYRELTWTDIQQFLTE